MIKFYRNLGKNEERRICYLNIAWQYMESKKVAFCTLGCKVNQYETNGMIQEFVKKGYEILEFDEVADVYIVNTCTVTNMADRKSRQMLRRVKELNPNAILVAVGCYAQVAKEELEKIPEIDLILGNNEKKNVISFVEKMLKEKAFEKEKCNNDNEQKNEKHVTSLNDQKHQKVKINDVLHCEEYVDFGDVTFTEKTRAVIKVQDGCDRFCSYCIIPFARGHIRSRKPDSVVSEITKIVKQGIKEVVITGIHLASYGRDFKKESAQELLQNESKSLINDKSESKVDNLEENDIKYNIIDNSQYGLIDLLEEINKIDGIERIRLRVIRTNTYYRRICGKII